MKTRIGVYLIAFIVLALGWSQATYSQTASETATATQMNSNTQRITAQEKMSGTQDFILKLLGILVPAVILVVQLKHGAQIKTLANSVDGMKDELVVEVRKAALLQGAATERKNPQGRRKAKPK